MTETRPTRPRPAFTAVWSCPTCEVSWASTRCEPCWVCGEPGRNGVPMAMFLSSNASWHYASDENQVGMVS